jgi:hypothetical protein
MTVRWRWSCTQSVVPLTRRPRAFLPKITSCGSALSHEQPGSGLRQWKDVSRSYTSPVTAHSSVGTPHAPRAHPGSTPVAPVYVSLSIGSPDGHTREALWKLVVVIQSLTHRAYDTSLAAGDPFSGRPASLNTHGMHHAQAMKHRCGARLGAHLTAWAHAC